MIRDSILAALISFGVSAAAGPFVIPALRRLKIGQTVRADGPETHLKKSGTPTMGGVIFLLGIALASFIFIGKHSGITPVLFLTVSFGVIGFIDDFIKVVLKRSTGLLAWQKFVLQLLVTAAFAWFLVRFEGISLDMAVPFCDKLVDPGWLGLPLLFFVVLGTDTGSNFTDGLDGLCSSVTAVIAAFFAIVAVTGLCGNEGADAAILSAAVLGGLLAFLLFNSYPAKVFMGDTGSLALGGFVAATAYMLHLQLFLLLIAVIYVIEVLSVMLQVSFFKLTHGKRIFKMAPIHHHFEKCGWSESRVVTVFTVITILACLLAVLILGGNAGA
ncbi:MAG: phospho-N-acetylmuramoyl-pentapeptide-transferase [Lachnospiraceae bacterium]|nr:phospho-N-acetylmuramoyl-pentapeptide-transferase [Lachnospiraceae bacterium]